MKPACGFVLNSTLIWRYEYLFYTFNLFFERRHCERREAGVVHGRTVYEPNDGIQNSGNRGLFEAFWIASS